MGRLAKALVVLVVIGLGALSAYAYFSDSLKPNPQPVSQSVTLNVD